MGRVSSKKEADDAMPSLPICYDTTLVYLAVVNLVTVVALALIKRKKKKDEEDDDANEG